MIEFVSFGKNEKITLGKDVPVGEGVKTLFIAICTQWTLSGLSSVHISSNVMSCLYSYFRERKSLKSETRQELVISSPSVLLLLLFRFHIHLCILSSVEPYLPLLLQSSLAVPVGFKTQTRQQAFETQ